jgi:hypothetical protein
MPEIYLTDFVDFVIRAGTPKLTKVREIKTRPDYSPAVDFWKPLREALVEFHKNGKPFDDLTGTIADPNKLRRYPDAIRAYRKFSRNKQIEWFEPPSGVWNAPDLRVRVNPELGLRLNGHDYCETLLQGRAVDPAAFGRSSPNDEGVSRSQSRTVGSNGGA